MKVVFADKLVINSCYFGAKGIEAVLRSCLHLEELSIKRIRGFAKSEPIKVMDPGAVIKAALVSRSSGSEPSPDNKHKQLSSSELQPASVSNLSSVSTHSRTAL